MVRERKEGFEVGEGGQGCVVNTRNKPRKFCVLKA